MFTTIYRPKTIDNFVGNKNCVQPFIRWLLDWEDNNVAINNKNNKNNKCLLISGLYGVGKSLLVELVLHKHDYNIIHLGLDVERSKTYMTSVINPILNTKKTVGGKENVLVVSEIDSGADHGFIASLIDCIKVSQIPIICICDNRYDQSIKPILPYCVDIKMTKPSYEEVYRFLYNIIVREKIKIKETEIKELYEQSNGDIRFILNNLQFSSKNYINKHKNKNIQSTNIFETTGKMLSIDENIDSKYETYWLSPDLHPLMIQENYVSNTLNVTDMARKIRNISYSADALSDMDLFETQVNMANWEFEPYVNTMAINAATKCNKKSMIKFPQFLGRTSIKNKNKKEKLNYEQVRFFKESFILGKDDNGEKVVKEKNPKEIKEAKEKKPKVVKEVKEKKTKVVKEDEIKEKKPRGRPKKTV
jgi:replication factor C subunit 1